MTGNMKEKIRKATLSIKGIHCGSCKALIEDVAGEIKGIKSCTVDVDKKTAQIEYTDKSDLEKLKKEVESLGEYTVNI